MRPLFKGTCTRVHRIKIAMLACILLGACSALDQGLDSSDPFGSVTNTIAEEVDLIALRVGRGGRIPP